MALGHVHRAGSSRRRKGLVGCGWFDVNDYKTRALEVEKGNIV